MKCARCGASLPPPPYYRRDTCPACDADLHACVQCVFFDSGAYNSCREPQAERQVDKERANVCDYYRPADRTGSESPDPKAAAKAALDRLFKK